MLTTDMTNFIEIYPDTLPKEFCRNFIEQFDKSSLQQPGRTGGGVDTSKKVSLDITLNQYPEFHSALQQATTSCTEKLSRYVESYFFTLISGITITLKHPKTNKPTVVTADNFNEVGKPNATNIMRYLFRLAPFTAQKYEKGVGNYGYWHSEIYPEINHNTALHRVLLIIIYLNDIEEGGETDFYYQNKSIKPKAGTMVVAPCGFTHTHRGNVPNSDNKYVLTSWVLFNPAEKIYTIK